MDKKEKKVELKPTNQGGRRILDKIKKEITESPKAAWSDFSQHRKG